MAEKTLEFKVDWSSRSKMRGPGDRSLGELIQKLRDRLAPKAEGLSITYVDDRSMRKLNLQHRGINKTTDVLSFPANPEKGSFQHLGDLVISLPMAEKMAKKLGVSRRREVETLIVHGFLHLCGHDHETDQGEMLALQAELERECLQEEPLPMLLKRGRKAGSKVKILKDGSRVVVTGRAAQALIRKEKVKAARKPAEKKARKEAKASQAAKSAKVSRTARAVKGAKADAPRRGPGRPRKTAQEAPKAAPRRAPRRRKSAAGRSGVIA